MNKAIHSRILSESLAFLSSNDIVINGPIEKIIRYFYSTDKHIDHHDIEKYALENKLEITFEDIEKTFDLLVEYGFARKKDFNGNKVVYEHLHLNEHHDHMICMKCGKIIEFYSPEIEEMQINESNRHGFHAFSHKMQIKGLCGSCFGVVSQALIPLSMVQDGGKFEVVKIGTTNKNDACFCGSKRLYDLGIVKKSRGEVIRNGRGGIIVNLEGNRIALGRGQSQRILVSLSN
ncbi:MAG: transcriptional repressor [Chitinispirillia bacterium]|jgi:Fur family ferric uptake transcriptional regulator